MTRDNLKRLIQEYISEVQMDEGTILNMQDVAENVTDKFRSFYTKFEPQLKKRYSYKRLYSKNSIVELGELINGLFFKKLTRKDTPIPILFSGDLPDSINALYDVSNGGANKSHILVNLYNFLTKKVDKKYNIRTPDEIDYNLLMSFIEHELIHYEQHRRSGKKTFIGSDYSVIDEKDPEIKQMLIDMPTKDVDETDEEYTDRVKYYNKKIELNTHAKAVANRFVKYWSDLFAKQGRSYTADELKKAVTHIFTDSQSPAGKAGFKLLKSIFKGYKYLTPKNRNKWWTHLYNSIMNMSYRGSR